jgi:hypothetical protein
VVTGTGGGGTGDDLLKFILEKFAPTKKPAVVEVLNFCANTPDAKRSRNSRIEYFIKVDFSRIS